MDLQLTRDGRVVVSHNPTLNPMLTRDASGKYVTKDQCDLRTMTLAEIRQFDIGVMNPEAGDYYHSHGQTQVPCPGARCPTLDEVFELANAYGNRKIQFNLETKSYADPTDPVAKNSPDPTLFVRKIYVVVERYQMRDRIFLQSFDWRTLKAMRALDPGVRCVALTSEQPSWGKDGCYLRLSEKAASPWLGGLNIHDFDGDYVKAAKAIGADGVSPYWEELTPELVREAHALGLRVVPWTVNDAKDMGKLIDWGVDGIISDRPWILRAELKARGISVPEPTVKLDSPFHTGTELREPTSQRPSSSSDSSH
jgi:glycerophosphoryl diester phosphodiesterase